MDSGQTDPVVHLATARRHGAAEPPTRGSPHRATPDDALDRFCRGLLRPLRGQPRLMKLFGQRAPTEIAARIVLMHLSARTPAARPTFTRVQQALPSPRRTAAFIGLLRALGLLTVEHDPQDRRRRYLIPGPQILDGLRGWLQVHLACLALLSPAAVRHVRALQDDPGFFRELVRHCAPWLERANRPITRQPLLAWLEEHDGGLHLALALLLVRHTADAAGWLPVSAAALARELCLSRSHACNLLNAMEARGLLHHDAARRRMRLEPAFVDAARTWMTAQLAWFGVAATRAEMARAAGRDQTIATDPLPIS
ncbi:MAG: hypothetical protein J0H19_19715 [Rhodospirillales bacterium]|nr:hypothetical protein [Rhodospirillales bacterium]